MGRTPYVDDIRLPGAVHAAFVRSSYPHAEIQAIHTDQATAHEGVRQLDAHHVPVFILAIDDVDGLPLHSCFTLDTKARAPHHLDIAFFKSDLQKRCWLDVSVP